MMKRMESMVVVLGLTLWGGGAVKGATIYVDTDATGSNNGSSWCDAYTNLSFALLIASFGGDEVRVAQGTYKPTTGTDRSLTFTMYDDVEAYGGYAGCGAIDPDARDISTFVTIMSGEINRS